MGLFDYDAAAPPEAQHGEIVFLEDFSSDDWNKILNIVETRHFQAGQDLVRNGEQDDSFYILSSGAADVIVRDTKGTESVLTTLPEGSVFGEISFFDGQPRSATIRSIRGGSAIRVSRANYETFAAWEPVLARKLLLELGKVLALRLRWTTKRTAN